MTCSTPPKAFFSEMKLRSWHSTKAAAGTWKATVGGVAPRSYQKLEAVNRDKASCPTMKDRKAKVQPAE